PLDARLKEVLISLSRSIAVTYRYQPLAEAAEGEALDREVRARRLLDHLSRHVAVGPFELTQALGLAHDQGLPRLNGGQASPIEQRFAQIVRQATPSPRAADGGSGEAVFTCRPLSKIEALDRGELGRDCSTSSVPLRALSPHHVYYGLSRDGARAPGY